MAYDTIDELLEHAPKNDTIVQNLIKAYTIINKPEYEKLLCSYSGGSDSDIMLDIIQQCDKEHKTHYIWYQTGLEWQATREHMKEIEEKYGIKIEPVKCQKTIPWTCLKIGRPFLSKRVSDYIGRLQSHNFQWEDDTYENLVKKYPKCQTALKWWCNAAESKQFCIRYNKWLKEFMLENPPTFSITNKCCIYAKEYTGNKILKQFNFDMQMIGVRKAEGGVRSTAYKNCYSQNTDKADQYRPVYFYSDADKAAYNDHYGIVNSKCYTEYGLRRTGCCACPFARNFEYELEVLKEHEPKLYKAVLNIFGPSYEYTRAYKKFYAEHEEKNNLT